MNRCTLWQNLHIHPGAIADYRALAAFHYRAGRPIAPARILAAHHHHTLAAVLVESFPTLNCALRNIALPNRYTRGNKQLAAQKLNAEMRTITRVIVHPAFRGIGLAEALVRHALNTAPTPYVEALAAMGRLHPFFRRAGMTQFDRPYDPAALRLIAALHQHALRPIDLADPARIRPTPALHRELLRFTHAHNAPWPTLITHAGRRLLSRPLYYLWPGASPNPKNPKCLCDSVPQCLCAFVPMNLYNPNPPF